MHLDQSSHPTQVAVARGPSAPAVHIGRQPRFPASPAAPRLGPDGVRCCDPLLTPPVSFLGRDAPSWTFHGGRPRAAAPLALLGAAATGGAADAPSDVAAPAPGAYAGAAAPSAFGPQVSSEAASAPAVRLPRAGRDAFLKQALSKAEEKVRAATAACIIYRKGRAAPARTGSSVATTAPTNRSPAGAFMPGQPGVQAPPEIEPGAAGAVRPPHHWVVLVRHRRPVQRPRGARPTSLNSSGQGEARQQQEGQQ